MDASAVALLLAWGVVVGTDLASVGQVMVSRPLVAGTIAGWIAGDIQIGVMVGAMLELFALEILPFGAARYPDYGLGAIAAAATAAGAPGLLAPGIAVGVGLLVAYLGEISIHIVRRLTSADVLRHDREIDAGDSAVIAGLHGRGLARDAVRGLLVTAVGLMLAVAVRTLHLLSIPHAVLLTTVAIGVGLGVAIMSAWRIARDEHWRVPWLVSGLLAGSIWVWLK